MSKLSINNHPSLLIRFANESDCDLILYFIKALAIYEKMLDMVVATKEDIYQSLFVNKSAEVILAYEDKNPVGFALFYTTYSTFLGKPSLFLEDMFIEEPYRNKGYGRQIFSYLAKIAISRNYPRIDWLCLDWNQKSIDFYQSIGAKKLDHWKVFRLHDQKITDLADTSIQND